MSKYIFYIFSFLLFYFITENSFAIQPSINAGDVFPDISMKGEFTAEDKKYLGFLDQKTYHLSNVKSDFLWIEIFSIYCPVCQKYADKLNTLSGLIQRDDFVNKNIKMIGIGAGNNNKEVEHFRKYFNVSFPLIPDPDFKIHKAMKETRTPLIVIVDKRSKPYKILVVQDFFKEPESLFEEIKTQLINHVIP
ncbi:MAG: redoxin family protein [Nitrospirota bacterium]